MSTFTDTTASSIFQESSNYSADAFGEDIHFSGVPTPDGLALIERINGFAHLPTDWDSHGAGPLPQDVVRLAAIAITAFDHKGCLPTKVMPGVGEDVGMLWELDRCRVLLEITTASWEWSVEYADGRAEFFEAEGDVQACAEQVRESLLKVKG